MDVCRVRQFNEAERKKVTLAFYMETWHYDFPAFYRMEAQNAGDDHLRMRTANGSVYFR